MSNFISTAELIQKYKLIFRKLRPVKSRAIDEVVNFNMVGFKHLIYKGSRRRDALSVYSRLVLVPLIVPVINNCEVIVETRTRHEVIDGKLILVRYFALESRVGKEMVRVRVVIRKIGENGQYYFYSIMKY